MESPLRVLIADLNHMAPGSEWSVLPVPLNAGYLASYAIAHFKGDLDVRVCKSPAEFIELVNHFEPHVVALSNYIWNANLAWSAANWVRSTRPSTLIVMGGPNVNTSETEVSLRFMQDRRAIDYYVPNEGEIPFLRILQAFSALSRDRSQLTQHSLEGTWSLTDDAKAFNAARLDVSIAEPAGGIDPRTGRLLDLDDIPSPYLSGVLDGFLADDSYIPLIETNRGCPYSCTFCSWGDMSKSKSSSFPVERVLKELDYIAAHNVSRVSYLYIGDANFGLFQRDVEVAGRLRHLKDSTGYPEHVYLYFAKNSSARVLKIAELLKDMTPISLSRQTQNPEVLANIKRSNIDIDTFTALSLQAKELGVESFAELIYALPGESKSSFIAGAKEILESDVDGLHFFPAMLLEGSEMSTQASRRLYGIQGEFRAIDGASGDYGSFAASEFEEIVTTTSVFTRRDYFAVRRFHFLQSVLVDADSGGRLFYPLRGLTRDNSLFPLIEALSTEAALNAGPFGRLLSDFEAHASRELVPPSEVAHSRFTARSTSESVKLNPYFLVRLLYSEGALEDFLATLRPLCVSVFDQDQDVVAAVLDFIAQRVYPFSGRTVSTGHTRIDPRRLAAAALATSDNPLSLADLQSTPMELTLTKSRTYEERVEGAVDGADKCRRIYDVAMHHSRENTGRLVTWRLASGEPIESEGRTITNDGGWLF
jgi:radical SAM superfamily enzyme YgiQ (UPF0313 family)